MLAGGATGELPLRQRVRNGTDPRLYAHANQRRPRESPFLYADLFDEREVNLPVGMWKRFDGGWEFG